MADPWDYTIGVDIAEVVRIRAAVRRWGNRFLDKHFTAAEIAYCRAKARPAESLAARFAAKEAFAKAFTGNRALSSCFSTFIAFSITRAARNSSIPEYMHHS